MNSAKKPAPSEEIDEIMNEIENLQEGMAETVQASKKTQSVKRPALKAVTPPNAATAPSEPGLESFHAEAGSDAPSIEDTLGAMKPEALSGPSLLDEAPAPEAEAQASAELAAITEAQIEAAVEEPAVEEPAVEPVSETDFPEVTSMDTNETHADGSLTLTLTGNMNLKLKYEIEGQEVTIGFVDHQLRVELADGTEFRVPLHRGLQAA